MLHTLQVTLLQSMWATAQTQVVMTASTPQADDDKSLYRLFGFSLFVRIRFRKRVSCGQLRRRLDTKFMQTRVQSICAGHVHTVALSGSCSYVTCTLDEFLRSPSCAAICGRCYAALARLSR